MFYRPGGTDGRINAQYDYVYSDVVNGATGWLPISKGDTIAVNIARALLNFVNATASSVTKSPVAPNAQIFLELKMFGGETNAEAWPIDQWQGVIVATSRRAVRGGWVRLRIVNIDAGGGDGVAMALQISRTGETGAVT